MVLHNNLTYSVPGYYYYVKGDTKGGTWRCIESVHQTGVTSDRVGFRTVLAVNERVPSGQSVSDDALYVGPFYLDVDSDSIKAAIRDTKKVVKQLQAHGVRSEDIYVWATGKKGFHVLVPMEVVTPVRGTRKLGRVWKRMAMAMGMPDTLDLSVYSTGKGRMWRVVNRERADTGTYKVAISHDELQEMTPDLYETLVSEPREQHVIQPAERSSAMYALFVRAIHLVSQEVTVQTFIDPESRRALMDEPNKLPPCAQWMLEGKNLDKSKGFNALSVQFAKAVSAFNPREAESLITQFAENVQGDSYNTVEKRKAHTMTAFRIAQRNTGYDWSCATALSVLTKEPCEACPVAFLRVQQEDEMAERVEAMKAKAKAEVTKYLKSDELEAEDEPVALESHGEGEANSEGNGLVDESETEAGGGESVPDRTQSGGEARPSESAHRSGASSSHIGQQVSSESPRGTDPTSEEAEDPEGVDPRPVSTLEGIDPANSQGLLEMPEGYGFGGTQGVRMITNFTLQIIKYYTEWVEQLEEYRTVATLAKVSIMGKVVGTVMLDQSAWDSKASFLKCFSGISNAGYTGKDEDVQRLRMVLMENMESRVPRVKRTEVFGIHYERVAGKDVFTYVEPGWSIDNFGNQDTYSMYGRSPNNAPELKTVQPLTTPEDLAKAAELVGTYYRLNEPVQATLITGWTAACFLKAHIAQAWKREFPLLNLHGNAEAGKTSGAMRWAELTGSNYRGKADTLNAPSSSYFTRWDAMRATMNAPLIIDEFNHSKMQKRGDYVNLAELMKEAYQWGSVLRGGLTSNRNTGRGAVGAETTSHRLVSPIMVCSEQAISNHPAVVTRSLQVGLRPGGLLVNGGAPKKAFTQLMQSWSMIERVARHLYMQALGTSVGQVRAWYEETQSLVPATLRERGQFQYQTVLVGHLFLKQAFPALMEADEARQIVLGHLDTDSKALTETKERSEVDIVLDKMAELAALVIDPDARDTLKAGVHYQVDGDTLYLDIILAYSIYRRYVALVDRVTPPIDNHRIFLGLAKNESYCQGIDVVIQDFAGGRPCAAFSLSGMAKKGIASGSFLE